MEKKDVLLSMEAAVLNRDYEKMISLLKEDGYQPFSKLKVQGFFLLDYAMIVGEDKMLYILIENGWDINQSDESKEHVLFTAIRMDKSNKIKNYLIKKGVNINQISIKGKNVLFWAAVREDIKFGKRLIQLGIDLNVLTENGDAVFEFMNQNCFESWLPFIMEREEELTEESLKRIKIKKMELLFR